MGSLHAACIVSVLYVTSVRVVIRYQGAEVSAGTGVRANRPPLPNPVAPGSALSVQHGTVPCGADEPRLPLLAPEHHASTLGVGTHACTGFKTTSEQQRRDRSDSLIDEFYHSSEESHRLLAASHLDDICSVQASATAALQYENEMLTPPGLRSLKHDLWAY